MLTIKKIGPAAVPHDAEQVMIPMRDGVRLAADVYLADAADPDGARPNAVVLVRLPYDKNGVYCFMPVVSRYFLARGYHVVVQDVRGKYRSEGAAEFGLHETDDGHDTIQWITEQPWCDGDVVMWGDSYYGYTTIAAAISGHPALKAISPRVTGSQLSMVLEHGDGTRDVEQTARKFYFASHYVDADRYEWEPDWSRRPLRATFEQFFTQLGKRSPNFDGEFTGESRFVPPPLKALLESPPVPALYTIGWFDNCAVWSWHDVRALSQNPAWADRLYLRLEAIDHENYWLGEAPVAPHDDHSGDPAALERMLPRYLDPAVEFFDAVLGRSGELAALPRVRYEVCHGEWQESDTWPPRQASDLEYHLSPDLRLTGEPPEGGLLQWTHNPSDLVPPVGANPFATLYDRSDLSSAGQREDVLRFTGPATGEDVDLAGTATLLLRLTAPAGAHVHARLLDMAPDGGAFLVAKGQLRLDVPLTGEEAVVDLQSIAYRLRAGHRLALDVMSSDFPDYVAECPDGADPWSSLPGEPVTRWITLGGSRPSCLRIGRWQPEQLRRTR
ncbi:CocE/NonD family hydrolase [Planomonospora sp. ID67723]|uniref:CocE/NonD family hydrolase n=1 Tax=Planomonospora sp. ID67723 TaxID=2738134 RepID=UPI0018C43980|nr:CocE/NonD family hydrolase [Planomonospora sp. ID67723]MBG0832696.1 CocE/NonD family hydrolase [Planomonospora sp. ID67723]